MARNVIRNVSLFGTSSKIDRDTRYPEINQQNISCSLTSALICDFCNYGNNNTITVIIQYFYSERFSLQIERRWVKVKTVWKNGFWDFIYRFLQQEKM